MHPQAHQRSNHAAILPSSWRDAGANIQWHVQVCPWLSHRIRSRMCPCPSWPWIIYPCVFLRGCFCDFPRCCSYGCTENHRASFSMPHLPVRWCLLLGSVANLPCSFLRARPSPQNPNIVRLPTVHWPLLRGHVRTVGARQASERSLRCRFRFSDVRADSQTFRDCCLKTRSQTWRAKFKISFRNLRHRFGISAV